MFCHLVGSTALSAKLDPEDLRGIITAYHRRCTELVERNGGFVAKYMGDGVLAYFGYPQAHEHDAERAVDAGLDLVEAVPKLATNASSPFAVLVRRFVDPGGARASGTGECNRHHFSDIQAGSHRSSMEGRPEYQRLSGMVAEILPGR
jgi:hypothetical protein